MIDELTIQIEIPTDEDGYVLFQCPKCGEYFKIAPSDYEDDEVEEVWCPNCGMVSDNYLTEDVIDLAMVKLGNACMDILHEEFKKLERQTKGRDVSFKAGSKPKPTPEERLIVRIDDLVKIKPPCCGKTIKLSPLSASAVYYCPFCGEMHESNE